MNPTSYKLLSKIASLSNKTTGCLKKSSPAVYGEYFL